MDYLQYPGVRKMAVIEPVEGFKPCYKWITFNTLITAL